MMKKILLLLCLISTKAIFSQSTIAPYIRLDMRYYSEDGERYLGTSPELITTGDDPLSIAMRKYPRRFRYILMNKTRFVGIYEKYYPDTVKINLLFTDSLSMDKPFTRLFDLLSAPFSGKKIQPIRLSRAHLLQVAARFFYCQSVRADGSIQSTICVGRNGLTDLNLGEHQSVLEAFSFEAIFEKYYTAPGKKNAFIDHFLLYIEEGRRKYGQLAGDSEKYLFKVREYCFKKMETDRALSDALMEYYQLHRQSFAFWIER